MGWWRFLIGWAKNQAAETKEVIESLAAVDVGSHLWPTLGKTHSHPYESTAVWVPEMILAAPCTIAEDLNFLVFSANALPGSTSRCLRSSRLVNDCCLSM
uniref:Secreted protein n=1 Tax=Ascaris lumbricoides TaxID=6252 RepID=A0A0M3HVB5_ASCLU